MAKTNAIYIVIIVVLLLVLAGIGLSTLYKNQISKAQQEGYDTGYTTGVSTSVYSIIQQSQNCKPVNLYAGNQTFQFIDVECLKAATQ